MAEEAGAIRCGPSAPRGGYKAITEEGEGPPNAMMDFGILVLREGECHECHLDRERTFRLMQGSVTFRGDRDEETSGTPICEPEHPWVRSRYEIT